jgi:hypothetical protein
MGLEHERYDDSLGGWASEYRYSEGNHRRFYRRWAEMMDSQSWPEAEAAKAAAE